MIFIIVFLIWSIALLAEYERPIVVIVPSYNNAAWYKKNLDSIFAQEYSNYRVYYCDDCSTDGTHELVRSYITDHGYQDRITIVHNSERKGAMYNHYWAVWRCADGEIVMHVDGDDWLHHNQVFKRINAEYADPDVWMTFGQFIMYPSNKVGHCAPLPENFTKIFREHDCPWYPSHLRTFYAWLFKSIDQHNFMYQGEFLSTTCDIAMMLPMVEKAGSHCHFISDVLYVYNQANVLNDFRICCGTQIQMRCYIRSLKPYMPLDKPLV